MLSPDMSVSQLLAQKGLSPDTVARLEKQSPLLTSEGQLRPRTALSGVRGDMGSQDITQGLKKEELLRLLLAGRKTSEISKILRIHTQTVRNYMAGVEFQTALKQADMTIWMQVDEELRLSKLSTVMQLQEMSQAALARMRELIDSEDESIAVRACSDTLDRTADTSKRTTTQNTNLVLKLDADQLLLAAQTAFEIGAGGATGMGLDPNLPYVGGATGLQRVPINAEEPLDAVLLQREDSPNG